jgi:hypothetical protein
MSNTTVFLLDIIDSNSLHGPVRELHQDNGISNQINLAGQQRESTCTWCWLRTSPAQTRREPRDSHSTPQEPIADNYNRTRTAWDAQRDHHHQHLQAVADPPTGRHATRDADVSTCSQLAHLPPAHLRNPWSIRHEAEVRAWSPCNRSCRTVGFGSLRTEEREGRRDG